MIWNRNRSVQLSYGCVIAFMVLLAATDIGGLWLTPRIAAWSRGTVFRDNNEPLIAIIYSMSVFGWILLFSLKRLLKNMKSGIVFDRANVKELRRASWCCFGACAICMASAAYYLPFSVVAIAAGFVGLVVRIVKNIFEHAIAMKDELDFTV